MMPADIVDLVICHNVGKNT